MRQSLQLRLGQHLTMTPQLQQAIRLLQLSSLDLQTEIQGVLESNLMLERPEESDAPPGPAAEAEATAEATSRETPDDAPASSDGAPEEQPVDSGWDELYDLHDGSTSYSRSDDEQWDFTRGVADAGSLREQLVWQMELTPFSEVDRAIAEAIVDAIAPSGYLTVSLEDIRQGMAGTTEVELDEVEAVLHRVQRFDPPGVAARGVAECLLLQLDTLPGDTPFLEGARRLIREQLELLGAHDFNALMRRLKVSREELQGIVELIQSLNPHPGTALSQDQAQYVVPDVFVTRHKGGWRVDLNPESAPRLRINAQYARLVRRADSSPDNAYLRNHLQEARWFLKSLRNRHETLLKVATCIVERQRPFFELGEEHMQPLVLRVVADQLGMHESTISRVTTQKYMHTPRGIFEFKYFFSSHVGTSDGGECSSIAIRAMIRKFIAAENPRKPLSDSKITQLLDDEGIQVARRTVAKYREAMTIPSSTERKRLT